MHFLSDKLSPPYFSGYTGLEIKETGDVKKRCITVAQKRMCMCIIITQFICDSLHGPHMPGAGFTHI